MSDSRPAPSASPPLASATGDPTSPAPGTGCRRPSWPGCVTSTRPSSSASARQFTGARTTSDLDEVLSRREVEAVAVATSAPTHAALALRALEAGKHVFVEKPLALTSADAREIGACRRARGHAAGRRAPARPPPGRGQAQGAGRHRRARPHALHLLQPSEPRPGPQRRERAVVAGRARHLGACCTSSASSRRPSRPRASASSTRASRTSCSATLRFPSGVIAHMHLSWMDPFKMRKMTIVGSDKMAVFDDMNPDEKVKIFNKGVSHSGHRERPRAGSPPPTASTCSCATATPPSRGSPARSRCGSSAGTSPAACAARRRRAAARPTASRSSRCWRRCSARSTPAAQSSRLTPGSRPRPDEQSLRVADKVRDLGVRAGVLPYRQRWVLSSADWDREYGGGVLDFYGDLRELARYSVLIGYVRAHGAALGTAPLDPRRRLRRRAAARAAARRRGRPLRRHRPVGGRRRAGHGARLRRRRVRRRHHAGGRNGPLST